MLHLVIYWMRPDGKRWAVAKDVPMHWNLASIAQYVDGDGTKVEAMNVYRTKKEAVFQADGTNEQYKANGTLAF